jgi:hypothetical protein
MDQATDETSAQSPPSPSPSPAPSSFSLDKSRQYISALSILAVALFVGLPVWWKTTEVYRCPLPYKEINDLSGNQVIIDHYNNGDRCTGSMHCITKICLYCDVHVLH